MRSLGVLGVAARGAGFFVEAGVAATVLSATSASHRLVGGRHNPDVEHQDVAEANGLSAMRWVLGSEWEFLDTCVICSATCTSSNSIERRQGLPRLGEFARLTTKYSPVHVFSHATIETRFGASRA